MEARDLFLSLGPETILDAVERIGVRCTGRCLQLNSLENRVFEVEVEVADESALKSPSEKFRVVKFYRPGRWSAEQIREEHRFLTDLRDEEIPAVAPIAFPNGDTLGCLEEHGIWFAVFPKQRGRNPDEFNDEQLEILGRLIARMHMVGARSEAPSRLRLDLETYALGNLEYLLKNEKVPKDLRDPYASIVREMVKLCEPLFAGVKYQRIHGDCHLGNLLWGTEGAFFVDFDDMVTGPCVQDIWLLLPGRDKYAKDQRDVLIDGYEEMRPFERSTLKLIEPLRALRYIHFSAWIAKRWDDPAFPPIFRTFGTLEYWREQLTDMHEQVELIRALFDDD